MNEAEAILTLLDRGPDAWDEIPEPLQSSPLVYTTLVSLDGSAVVMVPEEQRSIALYVFAAASSPHILEAQLVPYEFMTSEVCLAAVRQDGRMLQFVPKELKTRKVCIAAVRQWGGALNYVPDDLRAECVYVILPAPLRPKLGRRREEEIMAEESY